MRPEFIRRSLAAVMAVILVLSMQVMPAAADSAAADPAASEQQEAVRSGNTISGSFAAIDGMDIATIRYYKDAGFEDYAFAEFTYDEMTGKYDYSFEAPYSGFSAIEATSEAPRSDATVIAEYYSLNKWDGAVDTSWYNEEDTDFYLYYPAEFAGFAAIVNGSIDGTTPDYRVKGFRTDPEDRSVNRGLPDCIESDYYEVTALIAGVQDEAWKGVMKHDFANRRVHIMNDMDMGGVPGDQINHNLNKSVNAYDYPNWTPIGGEYLMDVADTSTMIIAFFNGTIEGHGHNINNLYCYRWSYRYKPDGTEIGTPYGYAQGCGLVGAMGSLYNDDRGKEEEPEISPAIRNLGLSGYIYGRRMVSGFVGCIGGGSNAAAGTSTAGGIRLENLANHADVYCTDSKGLGGIVGCSMTKGSIFNCYNDGNMNAEYPAPTGGIIGANEQMDIFCCYSSGIINTNGNRRGRGIGGDSAGYNYTVDDCYYLEGTSDDLADPEHNYPGYPGYYTANLASSVSVDVKSMSETQMMNGTVVYLSQEAQSGYNFRYFTLNGQPLSGKYVTVTGESEISAFFESAKPGTLKVADNPLVQISITKNGTIIDEDGNAKQVVSWPVLPGDSLFEGDVLIVEASLEEDAVCPDPDQVFSAEAGMANSFSYEFTYTGMETRTTSVKVFTVGSEINGDDVQLTLNVVPLTTQKLWRHIGDTSWYSEDEDTFTITTSNDHMNIMTDYLQYKKKPKVG